MFEEVNQTIAQQVANGVKFLNKVKPGWVNLINLDKLNMKNPNNCIIGQIYGDYCDVMKNLELEHKICRFNYGFSYCPGSENEWKRVIMNIRNCSILDIKPEDQEILTKDKVKNLLEQVMELGMTVRQNQLNGSENRSGRQVLEEFIKNNL